MWPCNLLVWLQKIISFAIWLPLKKGREIVITSRGHPVGRIVPVEKTLAGDLKIIPAKKLVSSLKKIKGMHLKVDLLAELLADRRRR